MSSSQPSMLQRLTSEQRKKLTIVGIVTGLVATACATPSLVRPTVETPLFSKANDNELYLNLTPVSGNLHLAYAFDNHWGAIATLSSAFPGLSNPFTGDQGGGSTAELGGAYYFQATPKTIFEILAGGGIGAHTLLETNLPIDMHYATFFGQANFGSSSLTNKTGLGLKFSEVYAYRYQTQQYDSTRLVTTVGTAGRLFVEPVFFTHSGGEHVRFAFQIGTVIPLAGSGIDYFPVNLALGMSFKF